MNRAPFIVIEPMSANLPLDRSPDIPAFDRHFFDGRERFTRIGSGSIGGKAKGLALMRESLVAHFDRAPINGVDVEIPALSVLATDVFDQFMIDNNLSDIALSDASDDHIAQAFQRADLPAQIVGDLRAMISQVHSPLAVRSSSHLEDAMYQPFASVYTTKMIPNNQFDVDTRFRRLVEAIKFVYASTFFANAKNYMLATEHTTHDEHMAVVIQEIVGRRHDDRFYPHISGVARSYNFYPSGHARPEDGVVDLALGLGKAIVDEGQAWAYSPRFPRANPPYNSINDLLKHTQTRFWAVNMGAPPPYDPIRETEYLQRFTLIDAEGDGVLASLISSYDAANDRIEPGLSARGPRILTFAPILQLDEVLLNDAVLAMLHVCEKTLGLPVEVEFAMTLGSHIHGPARLGFLQVRPMVVSEETIELSADELWSEDALVSSENVLGNGTLDGICDIVYVKSDAFSVLTTRVIAGEIEQLNRKLLEQGRAYVLIGFGRWGSSDPSLGIPVNFGQIAGAKVIIEATLPEILVTLSQGSHFFHNITSFRIPYFSVPPTAQKGINWEWLAHQNVVDETEHVRWVRTEQPLRIKVDGRTGRGVIRS